MKINELNLVEEHLNSNNSPFRFNAKELDEETGNYYYGARYYDPKWSIWLSVDPLAEEMPEWSSYAYTFNNPVNYVDPTGMAPEGGGCGCPPDCPDDMPDDIKPMVDYTDKVKRFFGLSKNKSDDVQTEEDTSWFEANFTIWGAKGTGDHSASSGINDEKGEKHSIEVDGVPSWLKMAEYAGKGWRMIFGLDEEVDGYPVTSDTSKKEDSVIILYYVSNNTEFVSRLAKDDNVVWKVGASSMDEAIKDTVKTMKTNMPKEHRYSDTYGVDSLKIKSK